MNLNFRKIFDWKIKNVQKPEYVVKNNGKDGFLVVVTYLYHGEKEVFFDLVDECLWVNETSPRQAANNYFNKMLQKMNAQKQMLKNHNENTK